MIDLTEQFKDCYLVMYSIAPDKTIDARKAYSLIPRTSSFGGSFIGVKGGSTYGIRFVKGATHLGLFDLSDPDNPVKLHSVCYDDLEIKKHVVVKCNGAFLIIKRGDKNFKFYITEHKTSAEHKRALSEQSKQDKPLDPQTRKINNSLKSIKHRN